MKLICYPFLPCNLHRDLMTQKVFIAKNSECVYRELISKTWKLEQGQDKIKRSYQSRISKIIHFSQSDRVTEAVVHRCSYEKEF